MRFRKNFFLILALLALGWIIYGFSVTGRVTGNQLASADAQESTAFQAGTMIGAGLAGSIFLCTGLPALIVFGLLSWRNGVGLRREREHRETIEAMRAQHGGTAAGR